jgi:acetyl-CoA C-acetyltransferase
MYVTGIGRTRFGILDKSLPELLYEAMYKALEDGHHRIPDIAMVVVANFLAGEAQNQLHLGSLVSSLLPGANLSAFRVEAACASGGMAVFQALSLLRDFENVLVVGGEKLNVLSNKRLYKGISMAGDFLRDQHEGLIFPAQYAIVASKYFRTYGITQDDLALISFKNYSNAARNPLAHFNYKNISLEVIKSSQLVCSPLRLFDCCPISDGAAAIVLSRYKKTNRDIEVVGTCAKTDAISLSQRKEFATFKAARSAAEAAYSTAGISPKEIDIAEVHDCFTIAEIIAMEDLGFCDRGKAIEMVKNGETSLSGRMAINTDGGLLADGHPIGATGIAQICEIVTQLRGEAEDRQVRNARIGLSHNVGGVGGTAVVHILRRTS